MTSGFDPDGSVYQVRWREGLRTIVYLYRHPHDTTQIARVIEALQGRSLVRLLGRLRSRPKGRALLASRPPLRDALADVAWLESLPEGTLGRAYLDRARDEGLQAGMSTYVDAGTAAERTSRLPDDEAFVQDFLFHAHDLFHVVTGYRTDLIGEVCLLAFTAPQTRNTGVFAMAALGVYSLRLPRLRGQRMALRAFVRALRAEWLCEQDWVALLARPLDEVRRDLKLEPVPIYTPLWVGAERRRRAGRAAATADARPSPHLATQAGS